MTTPTLARVQDVLVELVVSDLVLDRRRDLVAEVREFLLLREGNHALQELLERVNLGQEALHHIPEELREWRPTITRLVTAEAQRLEDESTRAKSTNRLWLWVTDVFNTQFMLVLLAIVAGFFGLRVTTPGGIVVEQSPPIVIPANP